MKIFSSLAFGIEGLSNCQCFFLFSDFVIFINFKLQPEEEASGKYMENRHRVQGRTEQTSSTTSDEQSSRARRNERTARLAIRRELPEQVSARGADVESEACQLTGETGCTRHSSQQ